MKRLLSILFCLSFAASSWAQEVREPQYPGGDKALQRFVGRNTIYPSDIRRKKDFSVVAELLIREDGTATWGKMKRPTDPRPSVIREVKRMLQKMPPWQPARDKDGRAVKSLVWVKIPFTQRLYVGADETVVVVEKAGTLAQQLSSLQQDTCSALTVRGKLNSSDIRTLRRMAGAEGGKGRLKMLDLSHAKIVTDKGTPYLVLDATAHQIMAVQHLELIDQGRKLPMAADYSAHGLGGDTIARPMLGKGVVKRTHFHLDDAVSETTSPTGNWYDNPIWNLAQLKKKDIRELQGHTFSVENGRCIYRAYTQKGVYCKDMFYHCPHLKYLMLPRGHQDAYKVHVENLQHTFLD